MRLKIVFHISYDLNKPDKDYESLYEEIKKLGAWCHPVDSTWYVDTESGAEEIRNKLLVVMDNSDQLVVTAANAPGAWSNLAENVSQWLQDHLS